MLRSCTHVYVYTFWRARFEKIIRCPTIPAKCCCFGFHHMQTDVHITHTTVGYYAEVPNLVMVETIDSVKLANKFQFQMEKQERELDIMIQVRSSA